MAEARGNYGESAEWRAVLLAAVEAVAQADTVGLALGDEAHGTAGAAPVRSRGNAGSCNGHWILPCSGLGRNAPIDPFLQPL
jgi:hypothetical protein